MLNHLTGADVFEENELFATLDPTTRSYKMQSGQEVLFTDTVGFIRKLPHNLIDAFKSTLEEAKYADILVHVVDASNENMDTQMHIVYETLEQLGVTDKPVITVFNKMDILKEKKLTEEENPYDMPILRDFKADYTLMASIKNNQGIDELIADIESVLREQKVYIARTLKYESAGIIQKIRKYGELLKEEYTEEGIEIECYVPVEIAGMIEKEQRK